MKDKAGSEVHVLQEL